MIAKTYVVCFKLDRFEIFIKILFNYQGLLSWRIDLRNWEGNGSVLKMLYKKR